MARFTKQRVIILAAAMVTSWILDAGVRGYFAARDYRKLAAIISSDPDFSHVVITHIAGLKHPLLDGYVDSDAVRNRLDARLEEAGVVLANNRVESRLEKHVLAYPLINLDLRK